MPIYISATTLKDYLSCSEIIKFKLSKSKQVSTDESIIGTVVHDIVSGKIDYAGPQSAASILSEHNLSTTKNIEFVDSCYNNYINNFYGLLTQDDKIEYSFKYKLYSDVFLVGRIDRISGGLIFDWKTDRSPSSKVENNIQLLFYELAFEKLFGSKPFGSYLGFLSNGALVKHKKSSDATDILNVLIEEVLHTIKSDTFSKRGKLTKSCYRCPFNRQCLGDG